MTQKSFSTVPTSEPLPIFSRESNIAFMAEPTYKCRVTYGPKTNSKHAATCLLDTVAGVKLINFSLINTSWKSRIKLESTSKLRTETRRPVRLDGLNFLHLRIHDISTCVSLGCVPHLAVNIFIGTAIIGRFIREIFPVQRKFVSRQLPPFALLTRNLQP